MPQDRPASPESAVSDDRFKADVSGMDHALTASTAEHGSSPIAKMAARAVGIFWIRRSSPLRILMAWPAESSVELQPVGSARAATTRALGRLQPGRNEDWNNKPGFAG